MDEATQSPTEEQVVTVRFYAELNRHLPPLKRGIAYHVPLARASTVGDLIRHEAVPLEEVDLVLAGGEPASFSRRLLSGERVAVYPVFESFDIAELAKERGRPLRKLRFLLASDLEPGESCALEERLHRAGLDVSVSRRASLEACILRAAAEGRVLLTRRADVLDDPRVTHAYVLRASDLEMAYREVLERFQLQDANARNVSHAGL